MFINRQRELATLERSYASGQAELYVLYGRRRVGKTELLRAFTSGKRHIFFVADLGTEASGLAELTRQISQFLYGSPEAIAPFGSWDAAFAMVARPAETERLVLALDEFTYLIGANPAFPSILQRVWDTRLAQTQLQLILCGSYVGMIEQQVLAYRAPLYGRRTGQWHLQPLGFEDARQFFPRLSAADHVRAYAILGGVPAYLAGFDAARPLLENVEQRVLSTGTFLYEEPRFLLRQELADPNRYFSILEAIAGGRTRQNEIAQAVGLAASSLPFYLSSLRELGLIERVVPATELHPEKSRRGIWRLRDHYLRFWFRFVYPNRSLLERGETRLPLRQVQEQLDQFVGPVFEQICQEHVWRLHAADQLGFAPRAVGRWWDDREEIDVAAIGDGDALLGECKWSARPVGTDALTDLHRRAASFARRHPGLRRHLALFSRSGFTPALATQAAEAGVRLITLADL
jgi:AAA+ ATPase superfamily predicted ATPase